MHERWARTARGWTTALASGLVAATLHSAAGGQFPHPVGILLAIVLSGIAGTVLAGRSQSAIRLTVSVAASQVVFHAVFTLFGSGRELGGAASARHSHHEQFMLSQTEHSTHVAAHSGPEMLAAHMLATAITVVMLRQAGRVFWGMREIAASLRRALSRFPAIAFDPQRGPARPPLGRGRTASAVPLALVAKLRYRGPPVVLVS